MAPETRSKASCKREEYTTPKRARFFDAWDNRNECDTVPSIAKAFAPSVTTAYRWLKQRDQLGSPGLRRTRKLSTRLGRKSKVSPEVCRMLVSPSQNPVRDQLYEAQIEYHKIPVQRRALLRQLKQHTNNGQRRKQAYVKKKFPKATCDKQTTYGMEHKGKDIKGFWRYIFFTDEAHIDPSAQAQGYILREDGTREDPENIQQRGKKEGVKLHIAGWVTWDAKCDKLEFYNNEEQHVEQPKGPPKPRKSKYESANNYNKRLQVWEAEKPHKVEVKPKGNAMTQKYYTERLLPIYIEAFNNLREKDLSQSEKWLFQEDGDPSHGMRKAGLAQSLKDSNNIKNLDHPPDSPDLNPIEACWNILKQRIRKRTWKTLEELKAIIQEEWDRITMQEVRARISEMPSGCISLVKTGGLPIKSKLW